VGSRSDQKTGKQENKRNKGGKKTSDKRRREGEEKNGQSAKRAGGGRKKTVPEKKKNKEVLRRPALQRIGTIPEGRIQANVLALRLPRCRTKAARDEYLGYKKGQKPMNNGEEGKKKSKLE